MRLGCPQQLAMDIARRSVCRVQVGCVLVDRAGRVFAWGWNHAGPTGLGVHAEQHALVRANRRRVVGATAYVAGWRGTKPVMSRPCEDWCWWGLKALGVAKVVYTLADGTWRGEKLGAAGG